MALITTGTVFAQRQNKKALLVIDVQENLLKTTSKMHADPGTILPFLYNLNKSISVFNAKNYPVIYTINEWTNPLVNALTGNVCKKGGEGTGIDKRVSLVSDHIYYKSKMNALTNKALLEYLHSEGITELYITGLFAEACVRATQKNATLGNFKVIIVEDAVGSRSANKKRKAMENCQKNGAKLVKAVELTQSVE